MKIAPDGVKLSRTLAYKSRPGVSFSGALGDVKAFLVAVNSASSAGLLIFGSGKSHSV